MVNAAPITPESNQATSDTTGPAVEMQQTLAGIAIASGIGLHLAQQTTVRLIPTDPGTGRYFVRTDIANPVTIPATAAHVVQTQLSTELGATAEASNPAAQQTVRTVEHLLAALVALEIDNVRIEIDGPELPLLDGSAKGWIEAIAPIGIQQQSAPREVPPPIAEPITVYADDAWVAAFPSPTLRFTYGIDFELAAIGSQWHSWAPTPGDLAGSFTADIAPARTFGLAHQIDYLRSKGLIQGGSLDNALICSHEGWVNPPLRFDNEPARHKMLDLIGDLGLVGDLPMAHYVAYKASHTLHVELAKRIEELAQ